VGAASAATLLAPAANAADDAALAQCAAVGDPVERLACYDRAQQQGDPSPAGPARPAPPPGDNPAQRFGLPEDSAVSITARIDGKFTEWKRGTLIRLDNGQVWQCMEEKSAYYPRLPDNAEVEITRGMLGYRMEIKAIKRRLYVRRVS